MPTYTYECPECGNRFNLFHSIMDESEKLCPECGENATRQMGGGSGISMNSNSSIASSVPSPPPSSGFG